MESLARTLPASWFCSVPLYQLERRAVFLKVWISSELLYGGLADRISVGIC
jgi:hypothetical protein